MVFSKFPNMFMLAVITLFGCVQVLAEQPRKGPVNICVVLLSKIGSVAFVDDFSSSQTEKKWKRLKRDFAWQSALMDKRHKTAIKQITSDKHFDINNILLSHHEESLSDEDKMTVQYLRDIFTWPVSELTEELVTYRAIGSNEAESFLSAKLGDVVSSKAFKSTSLSYAVAEDFARIYKKHGDKNAIVVRITIPVGTPILVVDYGSHFGTEMEVLLSDSYDYQINGENSVKLVNRTNKLQ